MNKANGTVHRITADKRLRYASPKLLSATSFIRKEKDRRAATSYNTVFVGSYASPNPPLADFAYTENVSHSLQARKNSEKENCSPILYLYSLLGGRSVAYCPKCENNYPIITSTEGSSYGVPVITERYNRWGEYIGYEESETYSVDIEALPRCSNCYSVFEFPNATSKEEFFYAKRDKLIKIWLSEHKKPEKPVKVVLGGGILSAVIIVGVAGVVTGAFTNEVIGFLVGVGVGGVWLGLVYWAIHEYPQDLKEYEDKIARWNERLNEL